MQTLSWDGIHLNTKMMYRQRESTKLSEDVQKVFATDLRRYDLATAAFVKDKPLDYCKPGV